MAMDSGLDGETLLRRVASCPGDFKLLVWRISEHFSPLPEVILLLLSQWLAVNIDIIFNHLHSEVHSEDHAFIQLSVKLKVGLQNQSLSVSPASLEYASLQVRR